MIYLRWDSRSHGSWWESVVRARADGLAAPSSDWIVGCGCCHDVADICSVMSTDMPVQTQL